MSTYWAASVFIILASVSAFLATAFIRGGIGMAESFVGMTVCLVLVSLNTMFLGIRITPSEREDVK